MKNKPVSVPKRLIYIKVGLKGLKELHFKLFLALALASGATRPHLGVSEHPPNPQFQGLKIDLCGYHCPNYFSKSAPDGIFVDLQKTFDTVDHKILLHKLEYYRICGVCNNWFKSCQTGNNLFPSMVTILNGNFCF